MWQADVTHWRLAGGEQVEILNLIDDHSRLFLASQAFATVKATDVVEVFRRAAQLHGLPASLLSDNGAIFTGRKVLLESELERLGIEFKNHKGRPVKLLIAEKSIRVIDLDGELIRELTLDPSRTYQPLRSR